STTSSWRSSSAHRTSSLKRRVLWNLNGFTALLVGVTVEAPFWAPSATYSASPMSNVHDSPSPKVIGVCAESVATHDPFWIAPSHGAIFCLGIESDPVANAVIVLPFG